MEDIVKYNLTKVSGPLLGANRKWQGHIIPNGVVSTDRLCEAIAADTNRSVEEVEFVVKSMKRMALTMVGKGYIVNIADGIVLKPVMKGAFPTKDALFDPEVNEVVVSAMTRGDARKCTLSKAKYVNETKKMCPVVHSIADSVHADDGVLYVGGTVYVQGKCLAIDTANADEGVFLLDPSTQEVVARGEVVKGDSQLVDATFVTWPPAGEYLFKIATRCGRGPDYSISSVIKPIVVRMA